MMIVVNVFVATVPILYESFAKPAMNMSRWLTFIPGGTSRHTDDICAPSLMAMA